jgi:amino-acid N-acetyltransferase
MPDVNEWRIRAATGRDMSDIQSLLAQSMLPTDDIESARPSFVVAIEDSAIIGVGGFERFGETGLLRSIAVRASRRRTGLGRVIMRELEQRAQKDGVSEFVLLTETAREFFQSLGYRVIERQAAPFPVQASAQFIRFCPQSACCMSKRLDRLSETDRV